MRAYVGIHLYAKWTEELVYSDDYFIYALSDDGTYLIADNETDYGKTLDTVTIADTCKGLPVQEIRDNLFYGSALVSVTIGKNVKVIGESAFEDSYIANIVLPSSVNTVKRRAFYHAYNLKTVLAEGLISVGEYAFYNCESHSSVTMDYATMIGEHAFERSNVETADLLYVKDIASYAFLDCKRLLTVNIEQCTFDTIKHSTFEGCVALNDIKFSSKVKTLEYSCFANTGFTSFDTRSLEKIGYNAFDSCRFLQNFTIKMYVSDLELSAFVNCNSLRAFTVINNPNFATYNDDGCLYNADVTELLFIPNNFSDYYLPATVKSYAVQAFSVARLSSITVDLYNEVFSSIDGNLYSKDGKTLIYYAAANADEEFTIAGGVTELASICFNNGPALIRIILPDTITKVNYWAFYNMRNLEEIVCPNEDVAALITLSEGEYDSMHEVYSCAKARVVVAE